MDSTIAVPRIDELQLDFTAPMPDDGMKDYGICAGDVVYFTACDHVENGQIAAVLVGDEIFVRVIWKNETRVCLVPANHAYASTVLMGSEMDRAKIIGRVAAYTRIYPDKHPGGVNQTDPTPNDPREVSE